MRSSSVKGRLLMAAVASAVGLFSTIEAQASPWLNASGANSGFGWSGGQNNTDRFGNPTVLPSGFYFNNTVNFSATGGGGSGASTTDFARVTVDTAGSVPAGAPLVHSITVREFGPWTNSISAASDFTVQADFAVFRQIPGPPGSTFSLPMATTFFADGTWESERTLTAGEVGNPNFADVDWRRFQITVTNTIQVNGSAPLGSTIVKSGMEIIIPEPASFLLLLAGFGPLVLRRSSR
jgi:hypothetical protein